MTSFCNTRWALYREYCHETALASQHKPNARQIAREELFAHQRTCPQCKMHLEAMQNMGRAIEHLEAQ